MQKAACANIKKQFIKGPILCIYKNMLFFCWSCLKKLTTVRRVKNYNLYKLRVLSSENFPTF